MQPSTCLHTTSLNSKGCTGVTMGISSVYGLGLIYRKMVCSFHRAEKVNACRDTAIHGIRDGRLKSTIYFSGVQERIHNGDMTTCIPDDDTYTIICLRMGQAIKFGVCLIVSLFSYTTATSKTQLRYKLSHLELPIVAAQRSHFECLIANTPIAACNQDLIFVLSSLCRCISIMMGNF